MAGLRSVLRAAAVTLVLSAGVSAAPAAEPAGPDAMDPRAAYEASQAAVGRQVGRHVLRDHQGAPLDLARFEGRPLVISLVFTSCSTVCPVVTDHLRDSVLKARRALGRDSFAVLTFGFNSSGDRPAQLTQFAEAHALAGIDNWYLASADPATTEAFLDQLGFRWRAVAGGFDHVTQTSILDARGRVYRQLYGEAFPLPVLMEPLKDLVLGSGVRSAAPDDLWARIVFICTVYNPLTGSYRFDYGIFFGIAVGGFSLLVTGIVILRLYLNNRRLAVAAQKGG